MVTNKLKKNIKYIFKKNIDTENKVLLNSFDLPQLSPAAKRTAQTLRGIDHKPAILIQGVMPRSGSNYIAEIIGYHPNVYSFPNEIYEFPLLNCVDDLLRMQNRFFQYFPKNKTRIGEIDFLPLFGSALIAYLYSFVPKDKILLVKSPYVENLNFFFKLFPYENLVLILRDGRDVVNSTIKTWPDKYAFSDICSTWDRNANMILNCNSHFNNNINSFLFIKFEEALNKSFDFIKQLCNKFKLDEQIYPYDRLNSVPVIGSSSLKAGGKVGWNRVEKPKNFNPIGHWNNWSHKKKRIFKKIAGETLQKSGYCCDFDWCN
jgi:protein-tyrosine sulfotransferase